jgi:hypothetical protein
MAKRKARNPLTPEQKKAIWAPIEANAGAGWHSYNERHVDGRDYENGGKPLAPTIDLDKPE